MLRTRMVGTARAFATAKRNSEAIVQAAKKSKPFLSDTIAKAAIGRNDDVAASFVSAFAPVVHQQRVSVTQVVRATETTAVIVGRDMKHDLVFQYNVRGARGASSANLDVMAGDVPHPRRALVEFQLRAEHYLAGRALAHASGHYLAAIDEVAKKAKNEKKAELAKVNGATHPETQSKTRSKSPRSVYTSATYTAYVNVEPVHMLMLCNFSYAHDTAEKVWRAPSSSSELLDGGKYGWVSPLFSTFRLTTDAANVSLSADLKDPGLSSFASALRDRLSITMVHLPLVPSSLDDETAWSRVATLPSHQEALKSPELRQWLYFLAHTSLVDGKVKMPPELKDNAIFSASARIAENELGPSSSIFSEVELVEALTLVQEEAQAKAAAQVAELQAKAAKANAQVAEEQAKAAAQVAELQAEVMRLKAGSGAP